MGRSKREPIPKKVRFEVFKRDSFTCQYCGKKAPDVVLELDHIEPVSKGGGNEIINLVTSCFDCNRGKSDKRLSDDAAISIQRQQLEQIQERRQQLEMFKEWRDELNLIEKETVDYLEEYIVATKQYANGVTDYGRDHLTKLVKKYGLEVVIDSIDKAFSQYEDLQRAFNKIEAICYYTENPMEEWEQTVYYIRGILSNRLSYINRYKVLEKLQEAYHEGIELDDLKMLSLEVKTYTEFMTTVDEWITEGKEEEYDGQENS